jgi:hypothetical protein
MSDASLATTDLVLTVEVALDEAAMRGRPGYYSGVRPNHRMPGRDYTFIGQLDFVDRELLQPGECCQARGTFVIAEQDRSKFQAGFTWPIAQGPAVVGHCKVIGGP